MAAYKNTTKLTFTINPVPRTDAALYRDRMHEFYSCLTKIPFRSQLVATRQAYALEVIRPGRIYAVYPCDYCGYYHVGRKPKVKK